MKLKIAYSSVVFGSLMILGSFFMLLNFDISEWNNTNLFRAKLNLDDIKKMINNYNENVAISNETKLSNLENDFTNILNKLDVDAYLYFYCQLAKKPVRMWVYHPKQDFPIPSETSTTTTTLNDKNIELLTVNKKLEQQQQQQIDEKFEFKKFYLKQFYHLVICKSEKIYMTIIIIFALCGCFIMFFGCFKIYINAYRLETKKTRNQCAINDLDNVDHLNSKNEKITKRKHQNYKCCCSFGSLTIDQDKQQEASNNLATNRAENLALKENLKSPSLSQKSLNFLNLKFLKRSSEQSNLKENKELLRLENNCPFIYDELPEFLTTKDKSTTTTPLAMATPIDIAIYNNNHTNSNKNSNFNTNNKTNIIYKNKNENKNNENKIIVNEVLSDKLLNYQPSMSSLPSCSLLPSLLTTPASPKPPSSPVPSLLQSPMLHVDKMPVQSQNTNKKTLFLISKNKNKRILENDKQNLAKNNIHLNNLNNNNKTKTEYVECVL
jgi:hypothetical protein